MQFTYENIGNSTFLVYEVNSTEKIDSLTVGILSNRQIPGITQTNFVQADGKTVLKYDVSSTVSAAHIFAGLVEKKHLMGILRGVVNAFSFAEENNIKASSILFDWDYIYTNVSTGETNLICLPLIMEETYEYDIKQSIIELINCLQFEQQEDTSYINKILNYLDTVEFSMQSFSIFLNTIDSKERMASPFEEINAGRTQAISQEQYMVHSNMSGQVPMGMSGQQPMGTPGQPQMGMSGQIPMGTPGQPQMGMSGQVPMGMSGQVPMGMPNQPQMERPSQNSFGTSVSNNVEAGQDEEITWSYLVLHFSKENVSKYIQQKKSRKQAKNLAKNGDENVQIVPGAPTQNGKSGYYGMPGQAPMGIPNQQLMGMPNQQPMGMPNQQPMGTTGRPMMPQQVMGTGMGYGETTVLDGANLAGETTVLGMDELMAYQRKVFIVRKKNGERVQITKPVFRIGKERSYVDYYIGDNTAISRSHAEILQRGEDYYIVDTNSTNHTYVNDLMLQSNVEAKLENGTHFRLANETFEMVISQ
ncbi:MAG: DUF6382 domain-containing protein [Agathobacter sp.]|nr:DUF6382 domain-containing protein [Agathobacter sp.]